MVPETGILSGNCHQIITTGLKLKLVRVSLHNATHCGWIDQVCRTSWICRPHVCDLRIPVSMGL